MQLRVEEGYARFLDVVATGRNLSLEDVENLAQGRVWDGATAMEKGLVDKMGTLEDAIAEAARLTGLTEFTPIYVQPELSPGQEFLRQLGRRGQMALGAGNNVELSGHGMAALGAGGNMGLGGHGLFGGLRQRAARVLGEQFDFLLRADDPGRIYAHCLLPPPAMLY